MGKYWLLPVLLMLSFTACKKKEIKKGDDINLEAAKWDDVKINRIQTVGSHNSYRKRTYQPIFDFVLGIASLLPAQYNPEGWDYDHLPIEEQLSNHRVRSLEIDIFYDPDGGQYSNRMGLSLVNEPVESGIADLDKPGYKVLHIPDVDYETHHITFKQSLKAVKDWSDKNPRHLPIVIYVETKLQTVADVLPSMGFTKAVPYDAAAADAIDEEIKSVFGNSLDNVITPDKLRGEFTTLNEAVLADNWPLLKDARGKVVFVMNGACMSLYRAGRTSLEGRAMFVFAEPGQSDAAFVIRNNSVSSQVAIAELVRSGYMVRTRSDSDTKQARSGDYTHHNAALASGAQIISTDYYIPDARCDTSAVFTCYRAELPGGVLARYSPAFTNEVSPKAPPVE